MCQTEIIETLRAFPLLEGLTEDELQQLAAVAQVKKYPAGTSIFHEGENLTQAFFVVDGLIGLEQRSSNHGDKRVHTLGPGELLGWSPLLGHHQMTATARSLTSTWLIAVEAEYALELCQHHPLFGFHLMRETAEALATRLTAARRHAPDGCYEEPAFIASMHEGAD